MMILLTPAFIQPAFRPPHDIITFQVEAIAPRTTEYTLPSAMLVTNMASCRSKYEELALRINPPKLQVDNTGCEWATKITVDSVNSRALAPLIPHTNTDRRHRSDQDRARRPIYRGMHAWCPLTCGVPAAWRQSEWTSSSSAPTRPQGGGASWVKSTLIAAILRAHHKSADTARVYPDRSPSTIVIDAMPAVRIRM
eukprot:1194917-Prorocentrum_minimum.AAC.4